MSKGQSKLYKHFSFIELFITHVLHTYLHKIGFNILSMHAGTYAARHIKIRKQALFHPPMLSRCVLACASITIDPPPCAQHE